ncbi:MAG: Gfo/Idh/MocA family oxidoreductase [Firmicutes bacterium]|nr:Gfo/Idh/MocA family oxidoreductase [Bacillota bacterium]
MVRWGVLSTARIGLNAVAPAILATPEAKLVAIASETEGKAEEWLKTLSANTGRALGDVKIYDTYDALIKDPDIDAVYIPLPNGLHSEWSIKAARAKKHVLCEKPAASDAKEARHTIDTCKAEGVLYMEAFMYQFNPQYARIKEILADGTIGEPKLIRSAFTFPLPDKGNIRYSQDLAGGSLMDVGCYCIHSARLLFGDEPISVCGSAKMDGGIDITMTGILNFSGGRMALFDVSFESASRQLMEIVGTEGVILVERPWKAEVEPAKLSIGPSRGYEDGPKFVTETLPFVSAYQLQVEAFGDAVKGRRPLPVNPEDAYKNMVVIDAVREAARTGRTVPITS